MQIQLFTTLCAAATFLVGQNREIGSFKTFDLNLVAGLKAKGGVDWMSRTSSWKKLKNDCFFLPFCFSNVTSRPLDAIFSFV